MKEFDLIVLVAALAGVAINYYGYPLLLAKLAEDNEKAQAASEGAHPLQSLPELYIVICTWEEEFFIFQKLQNLIELNYEQGKRKIIIIDGGSTDKTAAEVLRFKQLHPEEQISFTQLSIHNKPKQINFALQGIPRQALILLTDADTSISGNDALISTVTLLSANSCGVVGAWVSPSEKTHRPSDIAFWKFQNIMRTLEAQAGSVSIATGPYYAFRRDLCESLPPDCMADDVYISLLAHLAKKRVCYIDAISVCELRGPRTLCGMFYNKLRKAIWYSIEIERFAPCFWRMAGPGRLIIAMKLFQFFILPLLVPALVIEMVRFFFLGEALPIFATVVVILVLRKLRGALFSRLRQTSPSSPDGWSILQSLEYYLVVNLVLLTNILTIPFGRGRFATLRR